MNLLRFLTIKKYLSHWGKENTESWILVYQGLCRQTEWPLYLLQWLLTAGLYTSIFYWKKKNVNQDATVILLFVEKCVISLNFWKRNLISLTTVNSLYILSFYFAPLFLTAYFQRKFSFMLSFNQNTEDSRVIKI